MSKQIMTVVGFGPMGKSFTRLFSSDINVRVSSSRNVGEEVAENGAIMVADRVHAFASSDYIFLSVPLTALPALIDEVNTYSMDDAVIIDCCSARVPAEQLLSRLNRRHFGMHDIKKDEYCITGEINDEMTELFHRRGISINCMSPEEHDRINAVIGIGHFVGLSLGHFLSDDEMDILSGIGSGSKVMALVSHFVGNSSTTIKPTIQSILLIGYAAYEKMHLLPDFVREAAHCLMVCRTAVLGGHTQTCPDGHYQRVWYNSCKHRMCPQCAYLQVQKWLAKQKIRILRCDHFHVIFTIPEELRFLWHFNTKLMTQILFTCSRDALFELLADEKYMGAKPGIIASLHSWTKTLLVHPHIHCLVTGCGLSASGELKGAAKDFLLPYDLIKDSFRKHARKAILKALNKGELVLPDGMRAQRVENLMNKLGRKKWNVRICERYPHGSGVLTYLARYLKGGPISNNRIVEVTENNVTFNYGRKRRELMTLPIDEFIERFLRHVPQPNAILVRSYGLYCQNKKGELERCRALLGQEPIEEPENTQWQDCFKDSNDHPELCPICGKRLVMTSILKPTGMIPHQGSPPLLMPYLKEAA